MKYLSLMISILLALLGGALVSLIAGENPFHVYSVLLQGSFGSLNAVGYTLFYSTPFIFAGLAVALPFRVGLFNIGGEGQIYLSAIALSASAFAFPQFPFLSLGLCILSGALGGALWAGLAGLFKAWRGAHEVITTIMLNFIAMSLSNYLILYVWKDPSNQRPETSLFAENLWLSKLHLGDSPVNICFILALFAALGVWFLLERTDLGFRLKAVGQNASAAKMAGFSSAKAIIFSMMMGGALASGVALNDLLGTTHRLRDGFSQGYGFMGIAVAFLGRSNPLGVVSAAIFLAAIYNGSSQLELETHRMTRDFANVMQAIFILVVGIEPLVSKWSAQLARRRSERQK